MPKINKNYSINQNQTIKPCTIKATFATLLNYRSEKSSHLHCLSEFIDNSIASWIKTKSKNKNDESDVNGLEISITIEPDDSNKFQILKIEDNAGGMNCEELEQAIQPNNTKGKNNNQLNQYGVGMKLATFYLGSGIKIVTRKANEKECYLEFEVNEENKNKEAKFNIVQEKPKIFENKTGTIITVFNIYSDPNRRIQKRNIFNIHCNSGYGEICNGLGWRYCGLIKKGMKLKISFTNENGNTEEKFIQPFSLKAYTLTSARNALKSENVNFDLYKQNLTNKIKEKYVRREEEIKKITGGKNFIDTLNNDQPLIFEFKDQIEQKEVNVKWGILALKNSGENGSFTYKELEGFTLLHKGRAIKHGPSKINSNKSQGEVNISTVSFLNSESGGQTAVKRRLFGEIDLTNIETPEKNKSEFIWGPTGKNDILRIQNNIWNNMKEILNVMQDEESNPQSSIVESLNSSKKSRIAIKEAMVGNFEGMENLVVSDNKVQFEIQFNDSTNKFTIQHVPGEYTSDLFKVNNVKENDMTIYLNTNHYLIRDWIKENDTNALNIKSRLIYPLATIFGVSSVQNDKQHNSYINWQLFDGQTINFSAVFNMILKKLKGNN